MPSAVHAHQEHQGMPAWPPAAGRRCRHHGQMEEMEPATAVSSNLDFYTNAAGCALGG
ncbi:hypothetical protein ACXZ1M_11855 [Duganella sp. PWIR1]